MSAILHIDLTTGNLHIDTNNEKYKRNVRRELYFTLSYDVVFLGACDELKSPSSRLITGRLVTIGTGAFDLVMPAIKR